MNKKFKTVFLLVAIVLVFISAVAIIYGALNAGKSKSEILDDEAYLTAVDECIEMCKDYSSILEDSSNYDQAIAMYIENIENADLPQTKAYYAGNMITYALNIFSQESIAFESNLSSNGTVSPYLKPIEMLSEKQVQMRNLV